MKLDNQWSNHINRCLDKLIDTAYEPIAPIEFNGFFTKEQLPLDVALSRLKSDSKPMPVGLKWGDILEYAWLKANIKLPETFKYKEGTDVHDINGRRITMKLNPGGESALFLNGKSIGNRRNDWVSTDHHFYCDLRLTNDACAGEEFELVLETIATSGQKTCHVGPASPLQDTVFEHVAPYGEIGHSTYGIWNENVYQLWLDLTTLYEIAEYQSEGTSRRKNILNALKKFTDIVDFSLPTEEYLKTVDECREFLKPLMECKNGSSQATLYAFGHSHIDVAWLWPLCETERKCTRTFGATLRHMEEYPEYTFIISQPHLFQMTKDLYPDLYEAMKEKIAEGKIIPEGGMWVEADTNISGGESLIRQFIHGKRFFKDEFGIESKMLWLPDVFGYTGALPQIMEKCGIKYFSTTKIFWNYGGNYEFPYNYFNWKGIDGTTTVSFIHNDYNSFTSPKHLIPRWEDRRDQDTEINSFLVPYGYGDGGGGPTRDHIEYLLRQKDIEGAPKVKMASPLDFFEDLEKDGVAPTEEYVGELYFSAHRGTYTTQSKTKRNNRKSEVELRKCEILSSIANRVANLDYPLSTLDANWKLVLLNQFHDIIPGSSKAYVYETAEKQHADVLESARTLSNDALSALVNEDANSMTIFNSISYVRTELVKLPAGWIGAKYEDGTFVPTQIINNDVYANVTIPEFGFITITKCDTTVSSEKFAVATENSLENDFIKAEFNEYGEITYLFDKRTNKVINTGVCNQFKMYRDTPTEYEAWDIDANYFGKPVALTDKATMTIESEKGEVAIIKVVRKIHDSMMTQYISLKNDEDKIDFTTTIDWKERQKLLKVAFPVNVITNEAIHNIQFGYIKRSNHNSNILDKDRFEVCNHHYTALADQNHGVAVLNDCKYGVDALNDTISLTLLTAKTAPDPQADIKVHDFTYSLYVWNGTLLESDLNKYAYKINHPTISKVGFSKLVGSIITTNANSIIVETLKYAEEQPNCLILRVYESLGASIDTNLDINLPFKEIYECNMLEEDICKVEFNNVDGSNVVNCSFTPFEIKTYKLIF